MSERCVIVRDYPGALGCQARAGCPVDETGRRTEGARRSHAAAAGRAMNLTRGHTWHLHASANVIACSTGAHDRGSGRE